MYDDDDLRLIDPETELESPLDQIEPFDAQAAEAERPDPEEMLALLTSDTTSQQMLAARAFCELQDQRATPHLIRLLKDGCPLVRVSAAYALGRNPSDQSVAALVVQLGQDWNGYVRKGVVWALGNCSDRRSLEPLIDALQTDISAVRLWAASSLSQMADVSPEAAALALPPLVQSLQQDPVAAVRSNCAWTLGRLCQSQPLGELYTMAIAALINALSDADMGVQEDAKSTLLKLGDPRGLQAIEELELEGLL
jgi:HEAT repeat protein